MNTEGFYALLEPELKQRRWLVAYSGGLDSHVLLHLLATMPSRPPLQAIHINHQLSPQADDWQAHVESVCDALSIPCSVVRVSLQRDGKGLEDAARQARYTVFEQHCVSGDVLMQAHHRDDQAETLLLRLMRGAGPSGLAGIPRQRALGEAKLLRPLLDYDRSDLADYAEQHGLDYIEDDSNLDCSLDRNYLRHKVMPVLAERWPRFASNWAHSAHTLSEAAHSLQALAEIDLANAALRPEVFGISVDVKTLTSLSAARARAVIQLACQREGLTLPSRKQSRELQSQLLYARQDARPQVTWARCEARRYAERLYLLRSLPAFDPDYSSALTFDSQLQCKATLQGVGKLLVSIRSEATTPPCLQLRFRYGGERVRQPNGHSKSLSNWFQEQQVPPWLRERVPLIFEDDTLCAIGDLWRQPDSRVQSVQLNWLN